MFSRIGSHVMQSFSPVARQCNAAFSTSVLLSHSFNSRTTAAEVVADLDLSKKTILITGATAGLGEETARVLASKGAHLVLMNRNPEKAHALREKLVSETSARVDLVTTNLRSLKSVRDGADEFLKNGWKLDAMILNGGSFSSEYHCTEEGLEMQFGVNYLSHFYLCHLLIDRLRESRGRVVLMSSIVHILTRFSWFGSPTEWVAELDPKPVQVKDLTKSRGNWRLKRHILLMYAHSKYCMILFAMKLHREECKRTGNAKNRVNTYALHPGIISTGLADYFYANYSSLSAEQVKAIRKSNFFGPLMKDKAQGTATGVYCAVSPYCESESGLYYANCKPAWFMKSRSLKNEKLQDALWDHSLELITNFEKGKRLRND